MAKAKKAKRKVKAGKVVSAELKVDLGCGQTKQAGFVGVDYIKMPGVDVVHDLTTYPWPFDDDSVSEIHCSHYIEHVPLCNLPSGQDHLLAFFDEMYRILKPGGKAVIVAPYYSSHRCVQDPTHRRHICEQTFLYANKGWRDANRLDHYKVSADFEFTFGYGIPADSPWNTKADEYKSFAIKHHRNVVDDIHAHLTKNAPAK